MEPGRTEHFSALLIVTEPMSVQQEDESRSKTPDKVESRRILVLNDSSPLPSSLLAAPAPSSERNKSKSNRQMN